MSRGYLLSLFIAFCAVNLVDAACTNRFGPWTRGAPIPHWHQEGQPTLAVSSTRKMYVAGAFGTNDLIPTDTLDVYDFGTNTWTTSPARTPFNSSHVQAAYDGRYIYMIAGFSGKHPGNATNVAFRYDTRQDRFETLPNLPDWRASAAVVYVPTTKRLHYIGGLIDRLHDSPKHWSLDVTDPTSGWTDEEPFPQARNHLQGVFINGSIYLPGGQFGHDNNPKDQALFHAYNTVTRQFEVLPSLPSSRSHTEPGTLQINGRIVMFGGRFDGYPIHDDIIEYNPVEKAWNTIGKLPDGVWINPSAGFFFNVTKFGTKSPSNWIVLTAGGKQWDNCRSDVFIAEVLYDCNDTSQAPEVKFWGDAIAIPQSSPLDAVPMASSPIDSSPPSQAGQPPANFGVPQGPTSESSNTAYSSYIGVLFTLGSVIVGSLEALLWVLIK